MKKIITLVLLAISTLISGQEIKNQSQEIRQNNLYFGVSQSAFNFGTSIPISGKFAAWEGSGIFDYNAAGLLFNRWRGTGTLFTNAYIGQVYNSSGVGLSFDISDVNSKDSKPLRRMFISRGGNVGIGTSNPDSKLTVNGKIHCKEVLVDLDFPAPDYVFQKYYTGFSTLNNAYTMPTLEEVEEFTKKNHHLPEVPSAKEIQKEGLELKEMTKLLLQKIEELTLYTIEQEKRIKALEGKLKKKK